ncbi:MAG TPA: site-2 protease family protein [Candidatus Polarisedimenticolaceae bacterium]|nr:site-2 protease family protein [Candidatus Polarisedimenticolaceae bacterium]
MFGPRLRLCRVSGIAIKVDASWFLVAALVTWTLAVGLFPRDHLGLSSLSAWSMAVAAALGLFKSIVLHELGHALMARRMGLRIRTITLFIFGGLAEMEDEPKNARAEFLVAVAGPAVSVAVAVLALLAGLALRLVPLPYADLAADVCFYVAWANALLIAFNAIPAFPLDGGRVLRAALWGITGSMRKATRICSFLGQGFGFLLIAAGAVIAYWTGSLLAGAWTAVLGWFLRRAASLSWKQLLLRTALEGERVEHFMRRDPISVPPSLSVAELVSDYVTRFHHTMFPVLQGERLIGCVTTHRLREIPKEEWCRRSVASLLEAPSPENSISPETAAIHALQRMSHRGRLMVVEGDRLVGIVSMRDLLRLLATKVEVGEAA